MSYFERRTRREQKKKTDTPRKNSCIVEAKNALREDPNRLVIWCEGHAWVIPTGATDETENLYIPGNFVHNGRTYPFSISDLFGKMTYGELKKKMARGEANDITHHLKLGL